MNVKLMYILFLSLIFFKFTISSEATDICQIANFDDISSIQNIHEEIHKKALKQSTAIDLFIGDLSQVVKTDKIKIKPKDKFEKFIRDTISTIKEIKKENNLDDIKNIVNLLNFNKLIISALQKAVNSKLSLLENPAKFEILQPESTNDKLDLAQACFLIENNQEALENLKKSLAEFNLTKINLSAQNTEKFLKNWKLLKIGQRLAPYAFIGFSLLLKKLLIEQFKLVKPDQTNKDGFALIPSIVHLDNKPIIEIGLGIAFSPIIKKDATDFSDWSLKQLKKLSAYVKGEKGPSEVIKKPKLNFEDIIGFDAVKEEFNKVSNYFKEKKILDFVDSFVDHNYLLVGPTDIGANLADALANQITKVISKESKNAFCGVYEVNSYKLIDKKLTDIIREAEEHNYPCIIILSNLDWIIKHAKKKAEIWSNIIDGFNSLKNPSKQIFLVATTSKVDETISELSSCAKIINLQNPTADQRKEFFKKKLLERSINTADFDLENLAKLTENCSYFELGSMFRLACNKAHDSIEPLSQKHLEQSIKELMEFKEFKSY